jgi:polysaccharide biosynthesis protein VpsQ
MKYIAVLFSIFIIAVVVLADMGNLPHSIRRIYDFPNGDKLGHFILFGLLTFFVTRAFLTSFPTRPRSLVALSTGLLLTLLITVEEYSQQLFSSRTFDLTDLLASLLGLLVGGWMALKIMKRS